ncbi:MAG: hypothetical protein ACO3ZW_08605 [Opitutales bacterium]
MSNYIGLSYLEQLRYNHRNRPAGVFYLQVEGCHRYNLFDARYQEYYQ